MTWVITRLCTDCLSLDCVDVCPVDCIYQYDGTDKSIFRNQLYIDPEECIACSGCEVACPWEAIYEDCNVPDIFREDIHINSIIVNHESERSIPTVLDKPTPTSDQVETNKEKWSSATPSGG